MKAPRVEIPESRGRMMHTKQSCFIVGVIIGLMLVLSGYILVTKPDRPDLPSQSIGSEKALDKEVTTTSTTIIEVTTTVAPTTTKPKSIPRKTPRGKVAETKPVTGDIWWALALCETGGTNANTGNGFYGYFQFVPSTWRSVGGTGYPHQHGYEEQKAKAQILQSRSGWRPWPGCSKKLGLR